MLKEKLDLLMKIMERDASHISDEDKYNILNQIRDNLFLIMNYADVVFANEIQRPIFLHMEDGDVLENTMSEFEKENEDAYNELKGACMALNEACKAFCTAKICDFDLSDRKAVALFAKDVIIEFLDYGIERMFPSV